MSKQFSSRFWEPYDELVVQKAEEARIKPTELVRIATMAFVDSDLLSIHERVNAINEQVNLMRREQTEFVERMERLFWSSQ